MGADWHCNWRRRTAASRFSALRAVSAYETCATIWPAWTVRPRGQRALQANRRHKVDELLQFLQIAHLGERYPAQLSGGQRQRKWRTGAERWRSSSRSCFTGRAASAPWMHGGAP